MIGAFGSDIEAAKSHYENYGLSEGRTITFDPAQYLSNYDDLTQAFGSDYERATRHFINFGHKEGRTFESSATTSNATADPTTNDTLKIFNKETSTVFNITSGSLINGGSESDFVSLLQNETDGIISITNQNLTIETGEITVSTANELDETTTGTITASIATDSTVDSLVTLTGNNAYTIVINASDATGNTANDLNTIDAATSVQVDASQITDISGNYSDIIDLYSSDGVFGLDNEAITITDELSVSQANILDDLTTGVIAATIGSARVSDLLGSTSLSNANSNNAYAISISQEDAAVSASNLNAINALTSVPVDLANVTSITASDFADLDALHLDRGEFLNISGITAITVTDNGGSEGDESVDYGTLETIVDNYQTNFNSDLAFSFQSGDTIVIDTESELTAFLADIGSGALALTNQSIVINSALPITVSQANTIDELTEGSITASIATDSTIDDLVTLTGTNAYTIIINAVDATGSTASELNTILDALIQVGIPELSFGSLDANAITDISGDYADIETLYNSGVTGLGNEAITITDELTVAQANILDDLTTGSIVATIGSARVSELLDDSTPLLDANGNNAYTISISEEDAAVSASDLNAINAITSIAVNLANVNSITASDFTDLNPLNNSRGEFSNIEGITAITVSDNGGSEGDESVDYGTLETIVDNYQTNFNSDAVFTFQSGDTIVINTDSELSSFLTDIGSGALDLTNQSITINSAFPITVSQANTIDSSTTGTITASIATDSTVDSLVTLTGNNAYTIVINASDATGNTANDLNTIDAATSVQVDASQITDISGNYSDIIDLYTSSLPEILPPVGVTGLVMRLLLLQMSYQYRRQIFLMI